MDKEPIPGDIIIFNYDGPPIGTWKHAGIVTSYSEKEKKTDILTKKSFDVIECVVPYSMTREHVIYDGDVEGYFQEQIDYFKEKYKKKGLPKSDKEVMKLAYENYKNCKKVVKSSRAKIIRWKGQIGDLLTSIQIASDWSYIEDNPNKGHIQYTENLTRCAKAVMSCFVNLDSKKKERKYLEKVNKYIKAFKEKKIPVNESNDKEVSHFCSQFVASIWIATLSRDMELLKKAFPILPAKCAPKDLAKLSEKFPDYWESFELNKIL